MRPNLFWVDNLNYNRFIGTNSILYENKYGYVYINYASDFNECWVFIITPSTFLDIHPDLVNFISNRNLNSTSKSTSNTLLQTGATSTSLLFIKNLILADPCIETINSQVTPVTVLFKDLRDTLYAQTRLFKQPITIVSSFYLRGSEYTDTVECLVHYEVTHFDD